MAIISVDSSRRPSLLPEPVIELRVITHNGQPVSHGGLRVGSSPYGMPGTCAFFNGAMIPWPWSKVPEPSKPEPKPVKKEEPERRASIDSGGDVNCPYCRRYNFGVAGPGGWRVPDTPVECRDCGEKFIAYRPFGA